MASGSKKRRVSQSPSRSGATKKVRQASASASVHSRQGSPHSQLSRAKSVFYGHRDLYFPHNNNKDVTSLPTGDDYAFRIQVISTTTDTNTDVFKKAIQGLVKICFPQNILEEIGIEVVTQHMRNEHAPEQNIIKMTEIFRSEMVHRLTWMLSECLDTPVKVEASAKVIMAASASLHGEKIGEDVLGHVITSLHKLREKIFDKSTGHLANNTGMETLMFNTPVPEAIDEVRADKAMADASDESSADNVEQPRKSRRNSKKLKKEKLNKRTRLGHEGNENLEDADSTRDLKDAGLQHTREGKEGKISTSWRWDVEEGSYLEDMVVHFKRTSDLFAYHALPIARLQLGPQAKRKELRQEMESMLAKMPNAEFEKWVESFQKLENGDAAMLERISNPTPASHCIYSATSAPIIAQNKVMMTAKLNQGPDARNNISVLTPIVDLLWGRATFDYNQCCEVVQSFVDKLGARTATQSIGIPQFNSQTVVQTEQELKTRLMRCVPSGVRTFQHDKCRVEFETMLTPWVLVKTAAFPELLAEPLVFAYIFLTTVLDLVCDPQTSFSKSDTRTIKVYIFSTLQQRGITPNTIHSPSRIRISGPIGSILGERDIDDTTKRGLLERHLRFLAFEHKDKFPELKSTVLVRTWERETGQVW